MKITKNNYFKLKTGMRLFLIAELNRHIKLAGSPEKLSRALGYTDLYIRINLGRLRNEQSLVMLEKIYIKCVEVFG